MMKRLSSPMMERLSNPMIEAKKDFNMNKSIYDVTHSDGDFKNPTAVVPNARGLPEP